MHEINSNNCSFYSELINVKHLGLTSSINSNINIFFKYEKLYYCINYLNAYYAD